MADNDKRKETVTLRAVSRDEEGRKRVEKVETDTHNIETLKHIEKKLTDIGVVRKDRRPADGIPLNRQPKSGHGGKYTWEGPADMTTEDPAPAYIDEEDPNFVDEEAEEKILRGEVSGVAGFVVGEVEVPKLRGEGVARVDVDPHLNSNLH